MIKSKLPTGWLLHFEVQKGTDQEWSVQKLRESQRTFIVAKERAEQDKEYMKIYMYRIHVYILVRVLKKSFQTSQMFFSIVSK